MDHGRDSLPSRRVRASQKHKCARGSRNHKSRHIRTNNVAIDSTPCTTFQTSGSIKGNHSEMTGRRRSPDLLPIEHFWDVLRRQLQPSRNTGELTAQLRRLWHDLPQELSKQPVAENEEIELAVGELNSDVNGETFSYIGLLNQHLQSDAPIENDTVMYVYQPQYFQMLPSIMATVKKRTIANYIAFNIVYFFSEYSSDEIRNLTYGNTSRTQKSEERLCIRIAKTFMPLAIGRMYVDRYYSPLTRMHVSTIRMNYTTTS
ncbi:hypothetical protein AVEN_100292-1 [Araneus ventricosus]|uniref:Peptidase M13 N-terminal domain-containing protein n=1 Tax=Araneus ventricosus TaxID=182803 RepID=A0A4Y2S3B2_ARAVE|nr:hypothetical protein AVEN_100292-1 [Araneus ventricosus]